MLRVALPLSVVLLASLGTQAAGAATVTPVPGEIRAIAFSGDALVIARRPPRQRLVLERLAGGAPAQTILTTSSEDDDDEVTLAASADALAFALNPDSDDDFAPSRVMIGPSRGPLREAAACTAGLVVAPVAVFGSRIAWREGNCGEPAAEPNSVSPGVVAVGGADAAATVRRTTIPGERLLVGLVLGAADAGLAGTVAPSFFGFDTEVRAFSPAGLGEPVAASRGALVSPVGILGDGTRVFLQSGLDDDECGSNALFTVAPATIARRPITLGGCLLSASTLDPREGTGPVAAGDRIVAFLRGPSGSEGSPSEPRSIVSVRGDGSGRRVLVKGAYRRPEGVATDAGWVAWWQPRCTGGREIVVQQAPERTVRLAACRAEILTRSARVRNGRIGVRLRCSAGCAGSLYGRRGATRAFAFEAGTRTLQLPVALGRRRRATVRVELSVEHGPSRSAAISVRR
jgi:hypothetical protein